jgi:hypothetical protein
MIYHAYDRMGSTVSEPSESVMRALLLSLHSSDPEHPNVSLTHESEWCISVFGSGLAVLENVETGEGPWHMQDVSSEVALQLWLMLAAGQIEQLRNKQWLPSYGPSA